MKLPDYNSPDIKDEKEVKFTELTDVVKIIFERARLFKILHPISVFFFCLIRVFFPKTLLFFHDVGQNFYTDFFIIFFFSFFFLQIFFKISFHTPKIMLYHFEEVKVTLVVPKSCKKNILSKKVSR